MNGKEFIDCLGGHGIYNCGHRHPKILKAVQDQLQRQALLDPLRAVLARLLVAITPGRLQYSFFTNGGTESIEGCLNLARLATGRLAFIAATRSFHGKSTSSLTATSKAVFRKPYLPLIPGFHHVPFGDSDVIEKVLEICRFVGEDVAALILELIQGEGGVIVPPDDYLPRVRELCTQYGALLILDEVQTGMGRTGRMFCSEHWSVKPDILAFGKAFGGGVMPIGALATPEVWEKMMPNPFLHTTTFGGNPLGCAASIATVNVILEKNLCERSLELGSHPMKGLQDAVAAHPGVAMEARGPYDWRGIYQR